MNDADMLKVSEISWFVFHLDFMIEKGMNIFLILEVLPEIVTAR